VTNLFTIYFGVDIEKIWLTATEDLPTLKTEVQKILRAQPQANCQPSENGTPVSACKMIRQVESL